MRRFPGFFAALLLALSVTACRVGPNYKRPPAPAPPAFKEQPPEAFKEWRQAHPSDDVLRGKWWEMYNDPALNALEEQVNLSNENVLAAEAQFREASAAVRVVRSSLFPTLSAAPQISTAQGSRNLGAGQVSGVSTTGAAGLRTDFFLPLNVSYTADVWGAIRRSVTASAATAQASAAQLENARLSYQTLLAEDYFSMHGLDAQERLLTSTVKSYEEYLQLTQYRYQSGVASEGDVALAETQLENARASLIDVGVQRSQYEHAIAVLTGTPPANYTAEPLPLNSLPPAIPVAVPSELLERRPDIAANERQMAAANEQIGIARAAYFPTVTLSAAGGFESSSITNWLTWPSRLWSVGTQAADLIFDAGRRSGQVQESQAAYDATVANYRQTVLTAFQQVEDNLSALRILEQEAGVQAKSI